MTTWRKLTVALAAVVLITISTWISRPLDGNAVAAISAIVTAFVAGNAISNWRRPGDCPPPCPPAQPPTQPPVYNQDGGFQP